MTGVYIPRRAEQQIREGLEDIRVILVNGPRQAGKTTLVEQLVTEQRPYVTLDEPGTLETARRDLTSFIRSLGGG